MLTEKPILPDVTIPGKHGRNVYVSICEPESVMIDCYIIELAGQGYKISHNWDMDINHRDDMTPEMLRNVYAQNMTEIARSDIFIMMATVTNYSYPESFAELGVALMSKKPAIIVDFKNNPYIKSNPYYHAPCVFKAKDLYNLYKILDTLYENF
jgi:hypothetical protein